MQRELQDAIASGKVVRPEKKGEGEEPKLSIDEERLQAGDGAAQNAPDEDAQKDLAALATSVAVDPGVVGPAGSLRPARLRDHDALAAIGHAFGKRVVAFSVTEDAPAALRRFNGATIVRGAPDAIFLRADASRPHMAILGHELVHQLAADNKPLYDALVRSLRSLMKDTECRARYDRLYAGQDEAFKREEFIGDGFLEPEILERGRPAQPHAARAHRRCGARRIIDKPRAALAGKGPRTAHIFTDFDKALQLAGDALIRTNTCSIIASSYRAEVGRCLQ